MGSGVAFSSRMLFMRAITPLHVGSGRASAFHVDLPVQRDEFGFPTIWSSSLKGALRSWFRPGDDGERDLMKCIFGPEPRSPEVSEQGSAISVLDARLLFIPVRSLRRIWIYATSPHMLGMFNTYCEALGRGGLKLPSLSRKALVSSKDLLSEGGYIVVNEVRVEAEEAPGLVELLEGRIPQEILSELKGRGLVILPDIDSLSRVIVNRSMVVQYRVRLKMDSKTVEEGALWSEEYAPAGSVFVSAVVCRGSKCYRSPDDLCSSLAERYEKRLGGVIYVGGRETIGKGLVKLYWW